MAVAERMRTPSLGSRPASALGSSAVVRLPEAALSERGGLRSARSNRPRSGSATGTQIVSARRRGPVQPIGEGIGEFARLVERAVGSLKEHGGSDGSYEDVRRILADIRKQYDQVHLSAERREKELVEVRRELKILEVDPKGSGRQEAVRSLMTRLEETEAEIQEVSETRLVFEHIRERTRKELNIVQQKVRVMEEHLARKSQEVSKMQAGSRKAHQEKVDRIKKLEGMERELDQERTLCTWAIEDLKDSMQRRQTEVGHREDFEKWRYEVAMEAASKAFEATAGRYRKIYAIEKLTGNCLQKITFEQAEQSQAIEDGFQKIREVTGLTDVMDIVHKFLNRDAEQEQLRNAVHEAEQRLHSLREAEASTHGDGAAFDLLFDAKQPQRGLNSDLAEQDQQLGRAQRNHEELQKRLQRGTILLDGIVRWAQRVSRPLEPFAENDLPPCDTAADVPRHMEEISKAVHKFLQQAQEDMPAGKLAKLMSQASGKEYAEQHRLWADKEFVRTNCRVPVSRDALPPTSFEDMYRARGNPPVNEEVKALEEFKADRDSRKQESQRQIGDMDRAPPVQRAQKGRAPRPKSLPRKLTSAPEGSGRNTPGEPGQRSLAMGTTPKAQTAHARSAPSPLPAAPVSPTRANGRAALALTAGHTRPR